MNNHNSNDSFNCKICLELSSSPIITPCGHIYCWQCIYYWAQQVSSDQHLLCPFCRSSFQIDKVYPIYTGENHDLQSNIPKRPINNIINQNNQQQNSNQLAHQHISNPQAQFNLSSDLVNINQINQNVQLYSEQIVESLFYVEPDNLNTQDIKRKQKIFICFFVIILAFILNYNY